MGRRNCARRTTAHLTRAISVAQDDDTASPPSSFSVPVRAFKVVLCTLCANPLRLPRVCSRVIRAGTLFSGRNRLLPTT